MKKAAVVKIRGPLEGRALRVLRGVPGLQAEAGPRGLLVAGQTRTPIVVRARGRVGVAEAWDVLRTAQFETAPMLLVAEETTVAARDLLAGNQISVVDGLGNVHLQMPGLLVHLEGKRRPDKRGRGRTARLAGKAGVAAQVLLLQGDRDWRVQDLAREAQVSVGLAHRVLDRLERDGILKAEGAGPGRVRRVVNRAGLLDLWAEEGTDRNVERAVAYKLARDPRDLATTVGGALDQEGVAHAFTGAAAAALDAAFITAVPLTELWITGAVRFEDAAAAAKAEIVGEGGNLILLQTGDDTPLVFRRRRDDIWLANPFRVYRDLLRDPRRGREQAGNFREGVIGF